MVRPKREAASWTIAILWAHFWTASGPALPAPPPQGGAPTPRKSAAAKKDPFLSGKPFTFQELLDLIPDLFERRLLSGVEARGLAFPATPDNLERLRKAGASEGLLRLISRLAPPALPPAPAHACAGPVTVVCSPPECEVAILGVSHGRTQGGMKIIADLPPGKTSIAATREGYESAQIEVNLESGIPARTEITLTATASTREKFGAELFARMIQALGGEPGLRDVQSLAGSGTAIWQDSDGKRMEWAFTMRLLLPDNAYWEMTGAGMKWWVSRSTGHAKLGEKKWSPFWGGKLKGSREALEWENGVGTFLAYQLAAVAQRIRTGKVRLLASEAQPSGSEGIELRAEGTTETYVITLGQDLTPTRIVHQSASGVDSGLEVLYADYRTAGRARYPTSMAIKFTDSPKHGMEIHLTNVDPDASLQAKDFPR